MRILFREPSNQPLKMMEVENELEPIQKLIGGYLQMIPIGHEVVCILDEEGRLKELGNNFYHDIYGGIVGNVLFCSMGDGDFDSLTDEQIEYVEEYIGFPVVE